MNRKITFCLTSLLLVLAASAAQALGPKCNISVFSGTAIPTGDFSDEKKFDARTGFQVGGSAELAVNSMFAVGLDGSWNQNKNGTEGETVAIYDETDTQVGTGVFDKDKFSTWQIGAHGKYMLPMSGPLGIFGLVGVGVYNTTEKLSGTFTPTGGSAETVKDEEFFKTDSRFGGRVGLGGEFKAAPMWGIGAEADYNFMSQDKDKNFAGSSSLQYLSVHGMVTLHLGL